MHINLTEKERDFLTEFAAKQYEGSPDNLGTTTPIHVVERLRREFVCDGSDEAWFDWEYGGAEYEYLDELIAERRERHGEDIPTFGEAEFEEFNGVTVYNEEDYIKAFNLNVSSGRYVTWHEPIAFFLILDEARRYRDDYQKHNCDDCRIFTRSLGYDNRGDLPTFRSLLLRMGKTITAHDSSDRAPAPKGNLYSRHRMTWKDPQGRWGIDGVDLSKLDGRVYGALCKLKDYEDTGLSPEDVKQLNEHHKDGDNKNETISVDKPVTEQNESTVLNLTLTGHPHRIAEILNLLSKHQVTKGVALNLKSKELLPLKKQLNPCYQMLI